eukprot:superscaffoldBa00004387_g18800
MIVLLCFHLRLPFLKEKASDELNYAQDVTEFLCHMGRLMRVSDAEVRQQLVESVKSFYSCVAPKQLLDGLQPTSPGYRLQLLERSDLAKTLLLSMAALENQPTIKLQLLQTLKILSSSSDMNCALMLSAQGAETICLHMNEHDPSGEVLFHSSEILWNLLERGGKDEVTAQLSSIECVVYVSHVVLRCFHTWLMRLLNGFRHSDFQLRNDLLVITTLIAENPNSLLIVNAYFGQGHSFHGTGGRGSKKAHMRHCVRVLRSMTSLGDESVNQDLCDQGTINQLLGILMQMEASPDEEDAISLEMKSDIQLILSALCETNMHRKELFGSEGVEMAVHFLKKGSDKFYSGLGHNKLVLSTVDCVWSVQRNHSSL